MKYDEFFRFKGQLKTAIQTWTEDKIDTLLEGKEMARTLLKRGLNNWLTRQEASIDKGLDTALLFIADEHGHVDSDTMVDMAVELFREMDEREYRLIGGMATASVGHGAITITLPDNPYMDMIFGKWGTIRITSDDLLEFKDLLNSQKTSL